MKRFKGFSILLIVGLLSLVSCYMKTEHKIEAHIVLDIRELKDTANQIEDMVRSKKGDQSFFIPLEKNFLTGRAGLMPWKMLVPWRVDVAYGGVQIKFMTPEIQEAINRRGARLDKLEELMSKGCIGENNRGYVTYRPCPACKSDPQLMEEVNKLIKEETKDRKTIYATILEQNNLASDALPVVEKIFSQVQRKNAPPGSFIQQDNGTWIKK